ncbi:uncharacterized protein TNCV_35021 [Trichonephila clavipes]|nr:uncharacterized protein TNCV_35021 [Trichonephila clavipes]
MDEQLKDLWEGINALKNGQEGTRQEMQKGQQEMQKSQEETKNELKERMEKGQEERAQECVKEKITLKVEEKIAVVEEKIAVVDDEIVKKVGEEIQIIQERVEERIKEQVEDRIKEQVEERIKEQVEERIKEQVEERIKGNTCSCASPVSVKLSTYDGKTNWKVYKTQFCIISEGNGWTEGVKACQLAASLRGEAAEVLQTLPDVELLNLNSLYNALDLRFGQKYSKDYARLQMKTRLQKTGESLQEYSSEVERLANFAFSDHPATVREEAATQASRRDRQSIGGARVTAVKPCEYRLLKEMEKLKEEMETIKAGISNQEKRNFECWRYGGIGHLERNCPRSRKDENTVSSSKQEN